MRRLRAPLLAPLLALSLAALGPRAARPAWAAPAAASEPQESAAPAGPLLVVEAPPGLRRVAARVRAVPPRAFSGVMRLMGLSDPGPPIRVRLEPEGTRVARAVPSWISGFAVGGAGAVVLFPARSPSYPDSSLDDLLRHEVAHVLAARAAGGLPLPRWFDEGLAMIAGGTWGADDRARLVLELLLDRGATLAGLDRRFAGGEREVAGAYALAGAFVHDLVQRRGAAVPGRILAAVAAGAPFPRAFEDGAGTTLATAEADFWRRHSLQRWLPLATSSTTLWLGITLLALYAINRRRRRDAALRARWDQEELSSRLAPSDGSGGAPDDPEAGAPAALSGGKPAVRPASDPEEPTRGT
jgi:hypothetical protein